MSDPSHSTAEGTPLEDVDRVFAALAHASRRHILVVLRVRGGQMTAGQIAQRFSCSWPTTSRHLRILVQAGLVRAQRSGRERIYHLETRRLYSSAQRWLRWFDPDQEIVAGELTDRRAAPRPELDPGSPGG